VLDFDFSPIPPMSIIADIYCGTPEDQTAADAWKERVNWGNMLPEDYEDDQTDAE